MASEAREILVAIVLFDRITILDAVGPYEVLHLLPNVKVVFVGHQPGVYYAEMEFLGLPATKSFEEVPAADVLVVPGGFGTRKLLKDGVILDWIGKVHEGTLYTTSVCTGSLLLAAAGLLQGLDATTHWSCYDLLAQLGANPTKQRVVRQGKIITSAGVSSGIDMGLQLAALLTDELTAKAVQLAIEYDPQPPFDSGSVGKASEEVRAKAGEISARIRNQDAALRS